MKKNILTVPALFAALLLSACGEDLLMDAQRTETNSKEQQQLDITGNTPEQGGTDDNLVRLPWGGGSEQGGGIIEGLPDTGNTPEQGGTDDNLLKLPWG